jgi:predicted nucleic acid-binding protein
MILDVITDYIGDLHAATGPPMYGLSWHPTARLLAWFDAFVQRHEVLPVTTDVARCAGALRGQLQLRGQTRTQADMLIAATAQIHALTIVTRNVRDFDGCGVAVLNPFAY